jgi:hypothetical protein
MTTPSVTRPFPSCPACHGRGTDIRTARFTLIAEDFPDDGTGQPFTQVFGFYRQPGGDPDDLIQAPGFDIPGDSPVACLARQVAASPELSRTAGDWLRLGIFGCLCAGVGSCPALDDIQLLQAIEYATGTTP